MDTLLGTNPLPSFRLMLYLLLIGVLILAVFASFKRYVLPLVRYYRPRTRHLERWLPLLEAIAWTAYAMIAGFVVIRPNPLMGLIFVSVLLAAFWPFLRDLGAGILIRIWSYFPIGRKIRMGQYSGTVRVLGRLAAEIETDQGEVLVVPYYQLIREPVIRTSPSSRVKSRAFSLAIPKGIRPDLAAEKVKMQVLNMPWCMGGHPPSVSWVENGQEESQLRVVVYAIDEAHLARMQQLLETVLVDQP